MNLNNLKTDLELSDLLYTRLVKVIDSFEDDYAVDDELPNELIGEMALVMSLGAFIGNAYDLNQESMDDFMADIQAVIIDYRTRGNNNE
jgi:hypothetical protein